MGRFGRLLKVLGCFRRFWEALAASVRLCKALDALEGFGGFSSLWQVWKALGSFDVNMVCPLPGSWINHVVCILCTYLYDSVLMRCSLWQAVPESS